jgi:hypothetical protein
VPGGSAVRGQQHSSSAEQGVAPTHDRLARQLLAADAPNTAHPLSLFHDRDLHAQDVAVAMLVRGGVRHHLRAAAAAAAAANTARKSARHALPHTDESPTLTPVCTAAQHSAPAATWLTYKQLCCCTRSRQPAPLLTLLTAGSRL